MENIFVYIDGYSGEDIKYFVEDELVREGNNIGF